MLKSISFIFGENLLKVRDSDEVFEKLHINRMLPKLLIVLGQQSEVARIIRFFRVRSKCLKLDVRT